MQLKKYADSDFFLALMKDSDWLKEKAKKIYTENKDDIYITPFTVVEIMIVCKREDISIKDTLIQISRIAKLESLNWEIFFKTSDYVEKGATIFDSLMMASCNENVIIGSDSIYRKFGFNVIDLRKN
jgi:predicted nucleic acid-binding protein